MGMDTDPILRRRVLLAGDAEGRLAQLYQQVDNQQKRAGDFDVLFSVGGFLPAGQGASEAAAVLAQYVQGKRRTPIETYFIESSSAAFIDAAPEGKDLFAGVHFLGGFGLREIEGLRVAYLSGHYDPSVYSAQEAGTAGPAFVGAAYTPRAVEGLIRLAREPGAAPIDLLLTADWPRGFEEHLEKDEQPTAAKERPVDWRRDSAPPAARLCAVLQPRYHVFGRLDLFYQRPPFQTPGLGHVCRCIALGKVGGKSQERKWLHGLSLNPASEMPQAALMQRPENTTPCPFAVPLSLGGEEGAGSLKRPLESNDGVEELDEDSHVIPDQIFMSRLPPYIDERRLEKALEHVGTIVRIHLARDESAEGRPCKGFGWVTFSRKKEAQAACELSELLECGGRKICICLSRPSRCAKKREVQIKIEPHGDCWFCLVNPKVEKHMIVAVTTEVYVATARGPISPAHVLVLPVKHAPCFAACTPEMQEALQLHIQSIRAMCHHDKRELLVWERWIPMANSGANHMMLQVLPMDRELAHSAREVLQEVLKRHLPGCSLQSLADHGDVVEHLNDDATTPYIYFEIPGSNGTVERYVFAGTSGGPRIPVNLGRIFACRLLGCEDRLEWRQCQEGRDAEKQLAVAFREKFLPFQVRKK